MDIVVVHAEPKLSVNLDFLKGKLNCVYQLLPLHQMETSLSRLKKDFIIYFHFVSGGQLDNLDVVKRIKGTHNVPILTVIPKNEQMLESAFFHGADEVVYYPFSPQEFFIRAKALINRKFQTASPLPKQIFIQDLLINTDNYQVKRGEKILPITKLEFNILVTLATNPTKVFMKKELYETIWQDHYYDNGNVLNVHIRRLRKKIEVDPDHPKIIETKWGIGYKINLK